MAHLFYSTLGNTGYYNTSGSATGCSGTSPYCLTDDGPFSDLRPDRYWSGTEYAPNASSAWSFYFRKGDQSYNYKSNALRAWAVRPGDIGDIAPVPVPGVAWLFGGALALLGTGSVRRRRRGPVLRRG
jgi:hypothetical protein